MDLKLIIPLKVDSLGVSKARGLVYQSCISLPPQGRLLRDGQVRDFHLTNKKNAICTYNSHEDMNIK